MTASLPSRARQEVKVDLSGLSERQQLVRLHVIRLGEMAFGPRWQSYLAEILSGEVGRPVGQSQIGHWISGRRPVPEAMIDPLQRIAMRLAGDMERRADLIRADWGPDPSPEDLKGL